MWGMFSKLPNIPRARWNLSQHNLVASNFSRSEEQEIMIASNKIRSCVARCMQLELKSRPHQSTRLFSHGSRLRTDGVFRELTAQRTQMPWIEALRKQQKEGHSSPESAGTLQPPVDRDFSPKKMKDSYYSVVGVQSHSVETLAPHN